ncbi:MAG: helix-turn-helix domain-containing protein [Rhodocyclaceae bacterium]|nr:helix-turn-helix domain-containing protein [Rhodocyclaceae bacterium]
MHTPWINALTHQTNCLLARQPGKVFHTMGQEFESTLIRCALAATGGCRMDAARLLGIGRNTITRKIHAFGLDSSDASSHQLPKSQSRPRRTKNNEPHRGESNGEIAKNHFSR